MSTVFAASIGGQSVDALRLDGTALTGSIGGTTVRGLDFVGATLLQRETDGSVFSSTIAGITADAADPSGETLLYTLTATNPSTGAVENVCQPDLFGSTSAIPVLGTWDLAGAHVPSTSEITFGCTQGVIAKCVRWGYKPWKVVNGRSLAEYHQACTRMARADYCGDGTTHTEDGTEIDLYDDLGIQQRAPASLLSPMLFDAAWSASGAWCVQKERWLRLLTLASIPESCRQRFQLSLLTPSPVDPRDLCLAVRPDISPADVRIDNQSGINLSLF